MFRAHLSVIALVLRVVPRDSVRGVFPQSGSTSTIFHTASVLWGDLQPKSACSIDLSSASLHSEFLLLGAGTPLRSPLYALTGIVLGTRLVLKTSLKDHERADLASSREL